MTVDELTTRLQQLSADGYGEAQVVVVRDGDEIVWTPEGRVYAGRAEDFESRLYYLDEDAPEEARTVVAIE